MSDIHFPASNRRSPVPTMTQASGFLGAALLLLLCAVLLVGIAAFVVCFPVLALGVLGVHLAGLRTS